MKIEKITKKEDIYELLVSMSIFGCIHTATFIGTKDVNFATRMCNACPLYKDCFEKDTLKYELCCMLELLYATPLERSGIGVIYMLPESAIKIKNIIDSNLGIDNKTNKKEEEQCEKKEQKIIIDDDLDKTESEHEEKSSKRKFKFL